MIDFFLKIYYNNFEQFFFDFMHCKIDDLLWLRLVAGQNMVSKSSVQMQKAGQRESYGWTKRPESGKV